MPRDMRPWVFSYSGEKWVLLLMRVTSVAILMLLTCIVLLRFVRWSLVPQRIGAVAALFAFSVPGKFFLISRIYLLLLAWMRFKVPVFWCNICVLFFCSLFCPRVCFSRFRQSGGCSSADGHVCWVIVNFTLSGAGVNSSACIYAYFLLLSAVSLTCHSGGPCKLLFDCAVLV